MSQSQYAHLATPDPEWAAQFAKTPYREPANDVRIARERVGKYFISVSKEHFKPLLPQDSLYRVEDHHIPSGGGTCLVRTVTPTPPGEKRAFPCLVWMHGGGFSAGNIEFDDFRLRVVSVELQVTVVNVEYRLTPENPFPSGLNDCYDALKWTAENSDLIGASLSDGFFIGGMSAGANLAAAVAHRARDDAFFHGRPLTGQILQFPMVVHPNAYPEQFKEDLLSIDEDNKMVILTRPMVYDMYDKYGGSPTDPEVSPLLYPSQAGLPPTFIQVAGIDPLRDEGILYDKVLREAGVKTLLNTYPGLPHGFNLPYPGLKVSAKFEGDLKVGLKWLLNGAQ